MYNPIASFLLPFHLHFAAIPHQAESTWHRRQRHRRSRARSQLKSTGWLKQATLASIASNIALLTLHHGSTVPKRAIEEIKHKSVMENTQYYDAQGNMMPPPPPRPTTQGQHVPPQNSRFVDYVKCPHCGYDRNKMYYSWCYNCHAQIKPGDRFPLHV